MLSSKVLLSYESWSEYVIVLQFVRSCHLFTNESLHMFLFKISILDEIAIFVPTEDQEGKFLLIQCHLIAGTVNQCYAVNHLDNYLS